jgi:hypothetical protein
MSTTTVYVVTFKSDTYCFGSGPGTYAVEYDMGDLAAQFAASLAGTDAYDVEVEAHEVVEEEHEEECEGGDPAELVLVQIGPAL